MLYNSNTEIPHSSGGILQKENKKLKKTNFTN